MSLTYQEFIQRLDESLNELRDRPSVSLNPIDSSPVNRRSQHRKIRKAWKDFLSTAEKLGYVVPKGHQRDMITLHNTEYSPNDLGGRYVLDIG